MPIIIDTNRIPNCLAKTPDAVPILEAIASKRAIMVYGGTKLTNEYARNNNFLKIVLEFTRAGAAQVLPKAVVDALEANMLASGLMVSDDPHILAVALISKSRLLYTDDADLKTDFKNRRIISRPPGRIYNLTHSASLIRRFGK